MLELEDLITSQDRCHQKRGHVITLTTIFTRSLGAESVLAGQEEPGDAEHLGRDLY